jgi:hypothetical protein
VWCECTMHGWSGRIATMMEFRDGQPGWRGGVIVSLFARLGSHRGQRVACHSSGVSGWITAEGSSKQPV